MRSRRYSILVLVAVLAACGSSVPVGAIQVDAAQAPAQARVAEPATAGEVNPKLPGVDVHAPALMSTQEAAQPTYVTYPRELHGHWVGTSVQCPRPDYAGDTELVLEISSNEILGYEEIFRAVEVLPSSTSVASWRVETMIDVGPSGVFEKYGPMIFTVINGELSVDNGQRVVRYKKCAQWGDL